MQAVICQNLPHSLVSKTVIFYLIRRLTESGCALVLQECLLLWQAPSPSHACGGGRSRQVVKTTISGLWWVPSWVGRGCPSDMFKLQPWKGLHYIFSVLKAFSFIWIKIESTTAQVCLGEAEIQAAVLLCSPKTSCPWECSWPAAASIRTAQREQLTQISRQKRLEAEGNIKATFLH